MNVRVEFTGQLRTAIGRASQWIEMPEAATVGMLLVELTRYYGDDVRPHLVNAANQGQPSLLVAINGAAFPSRQAAATILREDDTIVLLPPIAGG